MRSIAVIINTLMEGWKTSDCHLHIRQAELLNGYRIITIGNVLMKLKEEMAVEKTGEGPGKKKCSPLLVEDARLIPILKQSLWCMRYNRTCRQTSTWLYAPMLLIKLWLDLLPR